MAATIKGPENEVRGIGRVPMKLEPWPGGRWFRDLGNDAGHFFGNVQSIKPPTLLEICGPLFVSFPAVSNVQCERGWAQLEPGWDDVMARIRSAAQKYSH